MRISDWSSDVCSSDLNKNSPAEACCRRAAPAGAWLSGPCKEKGAAAPLFACRDVAAASVLHPTPRCAAHVVGRHHLHGEAEGALLARVHGADADHLVRDLVAFVVTDGQHDRVLPRAALGRMAALAFPVDRGDGGWEERRV